MAAHLLLFSVIGCKLYCSVLHRDQNKHEYCLKLYIRMYALYEDIIVFFLINNILPRNKMKKKTPEYY